MHLLYLGGPDDWSNIIPLCPTGNDQVHWAIRTFVKTEGVIPLVMNRYLHDLAAKGYEAAFPTA